MDVDVLRAHLGAADGDLPCPLPGHDGSARLEVPSDDPEGELRWRCCRGRWRSLGEVRAAQGYGVDARRSNIALATWTRRLAWEAGLLEPIHIDLAELDFDAPAFVHRARAGFALLLGLRSADHELRGVAYSVRFCAAWCPLPLRAAWEGVRELRRRAVIEEVGRAGGCPLYLPSAGEDW